MNSKEALKKLKSMPTCSECELYGSCFGKPLCNELYNTIKQDLDRLEKLEKAHINYYKNKNVEDEQYPTLQQCHKEKLIVAQEGLARLHQIKKDLEVLEWLKKSIISKKRIQSLIETANPIYEIILHIPQNILKEVLENE